MSLGVSLTTTRFALQCSEEAHDGTIKLRELAHEGVSKSVPALVAVHPTNITTGTVAKGQWNRFTANTIPYLRSTIGLNQELDKSVESKIYADLLSAFYRSLDDSDKIVDPHFCAEHNITHLDDDIVQRLKQPSGINSFNVPLSITPSDDEITTNVGTEVLCAQLLATIHRSWALQSPRNVDLDFLTYRCTEDKSTIDSKLAPCNNMVLAVPPFYTIQQRAALYRAAQYAKLPICDIVNEPFALLHTYTLQGNIEKERFVIFFDLGFSQTTLSLARITPPGAASSAAGNQHGTLSNNPSNSSQPSPPKGDGKAVILDSVSHPNLGLKTIISHLLKQIYLSFLQKYDGRLNPQLTTLLKIENGTYFLRWFDAIQEGVKKLSETNCVHLELDVPQNWDEIHEDLYQYEFDLTIDKLNEAIRMLLARDAFAKLFQTIINNNAMTIFMPDYNTQLQTSQDYNQFFLDNVAIEMAGAGCRMGLVKQLLTETIVRLDVFSSFHNASSFAPSTTTTTTSTTNNNNNNNTTNSTAITPQPQNSVITSGTQPINLTPTASYHGENNSGLLSNVILNGFCFANHLNIDEAITRGCAFIAKTLRNPINQLQPHDTANPLTTQSTPLYETTHCGKTWHFFDEQAHVQKLTFPHVLMYHLFKLYNNTTYQDTMIQNIIVFHNIYNQNCLYNLYQTAFNELQSLKYKYASDDSDDDDYNTNNDNNNTKKPMTEDFKTYLDELVGFLDKSRKYGNYKYMQHQVGLFHHLQSGGLRDDYPVWDETDITNTGTDLPQLMTNKMIKNVQDQIRNWITKDKKVIATQNNNNNNTYSSSSPSSISIPEQQQQQRPNSSSSSSQSTSTLNNGNNNNNNNTNLASNQTMPVSTQQQKQQTNMSSTTSIHSNTISQTDMVKHNEEIISTLDIDPTKLIQMEAEQKDLLILALLRTLKQRSEDTIILSTQHQAAAMEKFELADQMAKVTQTMLQQENELIAKQQQIARLTEENQKITAKLEKKDELITKLEKEIMRANLKRAEKHGNTTPLQTAEPEPDDEDVVPDLLLRSGSIGSIASHNNIYSNNNNNNNQQNNTSGTNNARNAHRHSRQSMRSPETPDLRPNTPLLNSGSFCDEEDDGVLITPPNSNPTIVNGITITPVLSTTTSGHGHHNQPGAHSNRNRQPSKRNSRRK